MARPLALIAFTVGVFCARPNLGPTPVVAASVAPAAAAMTVETEADTIPESNPYSYPSQCTYRAWDLAAEAGHKMPNYGDAADWKQGALDDGLTVSDTLTPDCVGSVAVWAPYVGGTGWAGHVAWVTEVDGNRFHVLERNWIPGADGERWIEWEEGISFIIFPKPEPEPAPPAEPEPESEPEPALLAESEPAPPPEPTPAEEMQAHLRGEEMLKERSLWDLAQRKSKGCERVRLLRLSGIKLPPAEEQLLEALA